MRPLRVPLEELSAGVRRVGGGVARYVTRVHRLEAGDAIAFFDPASGLEADARVLAVARDSLECQIAAPRPSLYRPLPITLVQGLAKGDKPDLTLRDATALGVRGIHFVHTERAVVQVPGERSAARRERWRRIAVEAARQSGRGNLPELEGPTELGSALPNIAADLRWCLSPGGVPLHARLQSWVPERASVALLVGPEGGFSPAELQLAEQVGFAATGLGPTTLRSELCAVAALGALLAFATGREMEKDRDL